MLTMLYGSYGIAPGYVFMPLTRPSVAKPAGAAVMSAAILHEPVEWMPSAMELTSTSFLASRLEQRYASHLDSLLNRQSEQPIGTDGKLSIGAAAEAKAVRGLSSRLPTILASAGCEASTSIWGVSLATDDDERTSLLAAFLRAREWDVSKAESFLEESLTWRRESGLDQPSSEASSSSASASAAFPDDIIATSDATDAAGRPRTFVVLRLGALPRESLQLVDEMVAWRVRNQERACATLREQWANTPRGPTYTLILDCHGLRPYHFGRASRKALSALTFELTHYYPDFVDATVVVNAPGFLRGMWAVVSRLMPAWWGVRIDKSLEEVEKREAVCLH